MELLLLRKWLTEKSTIGELYVDGVFECFTLEDVVRNIGEKVIAETAIPEGRYQVIVNKSPKYGRLYPRLLNVPMFDGVLIHKGNKPEDSAGCILVGTSRKADWISGSKDAFDALFPRMLRAYNGGTEIWIEIRNPLEKFDS